AAHAAESGGARRSPARDGRCRPAGERRSTRVSRRRVRKGRQRRRCRKGTSASARPDEALRLLVRPVCLAHPTCPTLSRVTERPPRAPRAETREIVELRQLKAEQAELASAVDMQIAIVEMQRRVQARVPLPWIQVDPAWLAAQQASGRPLVRFSDIPLDWTD